MSRLENGDAKVIELDLILLSKLIFSFLMDFLKRKINSRLFLFSHNSFKSLSESNNGESFQINGIKFPLLWMNRLNFIGTVSLTSLGSDHKSRFLEKLKLEQCPRHVFPFFLDIAWVTNYGNN